MNGKTKLGIPLAVANILIYLLPFIGSAFFLITDGRDKSMKYNCMKSLFMSLAELIAAVILLLMGKIPYVGWIFTFLLWLVSVAYAAFMILSLVRALKNDEFRVPFFHDLAKRTL